MVSPENGLMIYDQQEFDIRCEWGEHGVSALAPISDVVIIVDVLSFSTSVDIAVSRGANVYPYSRRGEDAYAYAASIGALLASTQRKQPGYTLSPGSMASIPAGTRIVLPSLNGSILTMIAKPAPILAGCLRNAAAVASAACKFGRKIAVIPAGERWSDDYSLRPSFEDFAGAGAIIRGLPGSRSPESLLAVAAFEAVKLDLDNALRHCSSGKELIRDGFENDVALASMLGVSDCSPILVRDAFTHGGV
jgi:2-phosphosulfolactate phosphatase